MINFKMEKAITDWVTETFEGRQWLEDRIKEVLEGRRDSLAFDDHAQEFDHISVEDEQDAYAEAWEEGYDAAIEYAQTGKAQALAGGYGQTGNIRR